MLALGGTKQDFTWEKDQDIFVPWWAQLPVGRFGEGRLLSWQVLVGLEEYTVLDNNAFTSNPRAFSSQLLMLLGGAVGHRAVFFFCCLFLTIVYNYVPPLSKAGSMPPCSVLYQHADDSCPEGFLV